MREAKQTFEERVNKILDQHSVLSLVIVALVVLACLVLLFWFIVFSGLSSTADFIYAGF